MYRKLLLAMAINTLVMFVITYSMIWEFGHFHPNLNRFYMAVLMAAPMGIVMLLLMRAMYTDQRLNRILLATFALLTAGTFVLIRAQVGIGDRQFLHSMIPHHSGAILTCERASISDPAVENLCRRIVEAQKQEIAEMNALLERQ